MVNRTWVPEDLPTELNPSWARTWPPGLDRARRGIVYVGLETDVARHLVAEAAAKGPGTRPVLALAAVGPNLFIGRDGHGRWIPYDLDAVDENRERLVREREWPWCWGDVLWILIRWFEQPTYLRLQIEGVNSFVIGSPVVDGMPLISADTWLELRGRAEGALHVDPVGPGFWHGLGPPEGT